ncbi:MAG: helix-turn-helix transcriptional regulator, partial [Bacillota bacterium]|nr:helix-turn-helix transcriptional regulator [Bacillota bacterium]
MIIAEKIINLRKKNGWSQEELAEKLNVSRQSVSKWESAASIPDINRILELAQLFGVTTDYLLKDELGEEEFLSEYAKAEEDSATTVVDLQIAKDYLSRMNVYGKQVAKGVVLCILSPVLLIFMGGLSDQPDAVISENAACGLGVIVLILMIAAAVALFILNDARIKPYEYIKKGDFELAYGVKGLVKEIERKFEPQYTWGITIGVILCILSVVPLFICAFM